MLQAAPTSITTGADIERLLDILLVPAPAPAAPRADATFAGITAADLDTIFSGRDLSELRLAELNAAADVDLLDDMIADERSANSFILT